LTQGLLIVISIHCYNAIWGPAVWVAPCPFYPSLPLNTVFLYITSVGTVINVVANVYAVIMHVKENPQKGHTVKGALLTLWPFLALIFIVFTWLR